jgi:hypothetical protein
MSSTGEICPQSGVYKCSTHPSQEIPLTKGEKFPPCITVGRPAHGATWVLVKDLSTKK